MHKRQRRFGPKPRVVAQRLPWEMCPKTFKPHRGFGAGAMEYDDRYGWDDGRNPVGVVFLCVLNPG